MPVCFGSESYCNLSGIRINFLEVKIMVVWTDEEIGKEFKVSWKRLHGKLEVSSRDIPRAP